MHVRTRSQRPELVPGLEKYARKKMLENIEKRLEGEPKGKSISQTCNEGSRSSWLESPKLMNQSGRRSSLPNLRDDVSQGTKGIRIVPHVVNKARRSARLGDQRWRTLRTIWRHLLYFL